MPGMCHLSYEVLRPQTWQTFFNKTQNTQVAQQQIAHVAHVVLLIYYNTCCSYWYTYLYLSNSQKRKNSNLNRVLTAIAIHVEAGH